MDDSFRNDEKTAQDYKVQGGSVLHLVLALRGGLWDDSNFYKAILCANGKMNTKKLTYKLICF